MKTNAFSNGPLKQPTRKGLTFDRTLLGVLASFLAVAGMDVEAATWTWTGGASPDATWSNPGNWDAGSAPANGCDLVFPAGPSSKAPVNDIAQGTLSSINSVTIADAGYDVTSISGSTLTIANGFVNSSSSGVANWRIKLSLGQAQTFSTTTASASTAFFGTWNLNSYSLTISGSGNMDNSAVISGTGGITKNGTGTLGLANLGNNTYTGKTTVNGGTLFVIQESNLGANPGTSAADQLKLDGGTLQAGLDFAIDDANRGITLGAAGGTISVDFEKTLTIGKLIAGTGNLTKVGPGTVKLPTATSTYSGKTIISEGTLGINSELRLGSGTGTFVPDLLTISNGATLNFFGNVTISGAKRGLTVGPGGGIISVDDTMMTEIKNVITGVGSLTKTGPGSLKLSTAANTYTGKTIANAGTLMVDSENRLGNNPGSFTVDHLTIQDGATLEAFGSFTIDDSNRGLTLDSGVGTLLVDDGFTLGVTEAVAGSGALLKNGPGTLTFSGASGYSGGTTVSAGTLRAANVSGSATGTGAVAVGAGATLSGNGRVAGAVTVADDATAVLYPNSSGVITVGDDVTVDANSTIEFDLSSSAASGNDKVVMENKTLTISGSPQITINSAGILDTANYVLFDVGASGTISGSFNPAPIWAGTTPALAARYSVITVGKTVVLHYSAPTITVTATSDSKFYDGTTSASATPTITSGTLDSGDTGVFTESYNDRNVGSSKTLTPTGTIRDSGNANVTGRYNIIWTAANVGSVLDHKEDSGTTTITSPNTNTFALYLNNGTLLADNDPAGDSINGAGVITVNTAAILGGTGKVGGVTVNNGGTLAPGVNVGALSTSSETWNTDGAYAFQMSSATGTGGSDWDLVSITGNLNIAATITNAFTVKVYTLSGGAPGQAANFNNTLDYQWPIATATGNITGFDPTKFIVDASQFQNATESGKFSVKLSSDQKSVNLVFTPSCGINLTTSAYAIGSDGKVHMYFSNPFGFTTAGGLKAMILNNCTITAATAYGSGFESGLSLGGLPLTVVGQSTSISAGATRLEVVATKINGSQSSTVNVLVTDACGGQGGFDPVFTELRVQQGGVVRQSFSNIPAAEHYVGVVNGTPGLAWVSILVNGQVFALNPLADGQSVLLDVGAAMGEGNTNVVVLAGQGVAGASASITIGDLSVVTGALTPAAVVTGAEAQHWSSLAMVGETPVLQIASSGGNTVLSWSYMWDGFEVQTCADFAPQGSWAPVEASPALNNGQFTVPVPAGRGAFFRLYKP